jgi:hypothetical protein
MKNEALKKLVEEYLKKAETSVNAYFDKYPNKNNLQVLIPKDVDTDLINEDFVKKVDALFANHLPDEAAKAKVYYQDCIFAYVSSKRS